MILPREVHVSVSDGDGTSNEAVAYINFNATNDPPHVDINGPSIPGVDYKAKFVEGSASGVEVCTPTDGQTLKQTDTQT